MVSITREDATAPVRGSNRIPRVTASLTSRSLRDIAFRAAGGIINSGPWGRYSDAARRRATSSRVLEHEEEEEYDKREAIRRQGGEGGGRGTNRDTGKTATRARGVTRERPKRAKGGAHGYF